MKKLIFAIDFDNTWTEDPDLWREFHNLCLLSGHTVIIATARNEDHDNEDMKRYDLPDGIPIVFSKGNFKRTYCEEAGYKVDIWIDDTPSMIDQGLILNQNEEL